MSFVHDKWTTVSQLTTQIKKTIQMDSALQQVWLRAEISNFKRHSRGHMYFTLKDEKSRISAVMFAGNNRFLTFQPENGMKVLIKGYVSVYEPFGQYQLYVNEMEPDGIGQLYIRYEELKKQLEKEGLFHEGRKKSLPSFPLEIAVITSPTGAAIRDIFTTLKRRFPLARISLFPVLVQGEHAPPSIVNAMEKAEQMGGFDLLIFGRGGGSIEELWAFNEEIVARKIAELTIPSISAVGHETDFTIADFTADLRAATPTAAAELAVPVLDELEKERGQLTARLQKTMHDQLVQEKEKLARFKRSYAFKYPTHLIKQKEQELDQMLERLFKALSGQKQTAKERLSTLNKRLKRQHPYRLLEQEKRRLMQADGMQKKAVERLVAEKQERFRHSLQKLHILNPLDIMQRGYNVAYDEEGTLVTSVDQVTPDDNVSLYMHDGTVHVKAESVSKKTILDDRKVKEEEKDNGR
ncbi:Exodeoxyribonuclease VII large subunit [Alteribacillus persepolensis]|uniref:Exodeoxyribonuclease 7 large subunit n=1 Tax=Alteribacillus persepolensis TaxID=568899 RepID=A0A1G8D1K5_9BACI|nr:exodeoxyribonuclease VII large subunit [Alteribacillus persepolensis]SDH51269.1 Exodeoxyribonuclease VII large subunit [Alteribacillus persepolensis]